MAQLKRSLKTQDPSAVKRYYIDWASVVGENSIISSEWDVPDGITGDLADHDATKTSIRISGGVSGQVYRITNHISISSADGEEDEGTLVFRINEQ